MRTLIRGGWVIGFDGSSHTLIRDGVVVYEGDRIVLVGHAFNGSADAEIDARGKLVSPGFVDTHVHAGHKATQRLTADTGRREFFGQPWLEFRLARPGTRVGGDLSEEAALARARFEAAFTVAELLRNGITTFLELGSRLSLQRALLDVAARAGIRAYLGPSLHSGGWHANKHGRLERRLDPDGSRRELERAAGFIRQVDLSRGDRLRGLALAPTVDTCTVETLRQARNLATELRIPLFIHAANSVIEFMQTAIDHGMTPIELLDSIGFLGPDVIIGHGNFLGEHAVMNFSGGRDLDIMAASGVTVSHCPVNLVRRGRSLDSWSRYRRAGVRLALGTDTYPRDMIEQMRTASYFGKVIGHDLFAAPAPEVYEAATLGGSRALGRDDLGRLAPGAKADIIVIDLLGKNTLRYGAVRDPIRSLVECGVGDDVETVIIDGVTCMLDREIPGVDLTMLREQAQELAETVWGQVQEWDPLARTAEEINPWSFPLVE